MQDCSVATGDAWLKAHVVPLLRSPKLRGGVVFVVFDEGTSDIGGGGRIAALALGPTVRRGSRFTGRRTTTACCARSKDAWRLPRLGFSRKGTPIGGIWASRSPGLGAESVRACSPRSHAHSRSATTRSAMALASRRSPSPSRWGWAGIASGFAPFAGRRRCTTSARSRFGRSYSASQGPLTLEEVAEIRRHPAAGAKLVMPLRRFHDALPYVLFHHERWDGDGYPGGAERTQDPDRGPHPRDRRRLRRDDLAAALPPRAHARARARRGGGGAGAQFDPVAAELFVEAWADGWDVWQRAAAAS
jgi:hypothetical protein